MVLSGLDLFSGIGGISLALSPWVRPIAYCENDRYAQGVLLSRMRNEQLPLAPIWDDVRTISREQLGDVQIDIIYGGFPCQDISSAGIGAGLDGKQSGLFFEVHRLAREIRPAFLFLENVPRIRVRGLGTVINALAGIGYGCRWQMLSADEIGAPHKRKRWFLLAHANNFDRNKFGNLPQENGGEGRSKIKRKNKANKLDDATWGKTEPDIFRVANGIPYQLDRHRCLANAVVPQQAREAFVRLMGLA